MRYWRQETRNGEQVRLQERRKEKKGISGMDGAPSVC